MYRTGASFGDSGRFASNLTIQVRQNFEWIDASDLNVQPEYSYDSSAVLDKVYSFSFGKAVGEGVQIIGVLDVNSSFTSVGELTVYYVE